MYEYEVQLKIEGERARLTHRGGFWLQQLLHVALAKAFHAGTARLRKGLDVWSLILSSFPFQVRHQRLDVRKSDALNVFILRSACVQHEKVSLVFREPIAAAWCGK